MNPVLKNEHCVPDPEVRVWEDGRLYVYGSYDIKGKDDYCSKKYKVFSTDNLHDWEDHGTSFTSFDAPWNSDVALFAPDCVFKDNKYWLYYCAYDKKALEGVAWSKSPWGPFKEGKKLKASKEGIDPTVLVDDDGSAYIYWGQKNLNGARLNEDMISIDETSLNTKILTESDHGFHEGASIRKISNLYYMIFTDISRGYATCLSYAISEKPLGPFEKKGVIIDNRNINYMSWNNHGSICKFNNQWYVFYHRCSLGNKFSRQLSIEKITIEKNGFIKEVIPTTSGAEDYIIAKQFIEARRFCFTYGDIQTRIIEGNECLICKKSGSYASYKYLCFDNEDTITIMAKGRGEILGYYDELFWEPVFACQIDSDEVKEYKVSTLKVSGVQSFHLWFMGDNIEVFGFEFK